jgi:predicted metalloendopeptidase
LLTSCQRLADNLLQGYRPATQQFVNKLWVTTLWQLDKITALLQLVDKLATSLLQTRLVDKLWDFYMCTLLFSSV